MDKKGGTALLLFLFEGNRQEALIVEKQLQFTPYDVNFHHLFSLS